MGLLLVASAVAQGESETAEKPVLFTTHIAVDGVDQLLVVHEGDAPAQIAQDFGAKYGLDEEAVVNVAKHIQAKAGKFLKRVFFYYPFYVEIDGKSQMMNLTVYEDSDAKELGQKVAQKYGLPESSAERLRVAIEDEFLQRVKLKVNVDMEKTGEKKLLLVLKTDTAETAAKRFAIQNGISTAGALDLEKHIGDQLLALGVRNARIKKEMAASEAAEAAAAAEGGQ